MKHTNITKTQKISIVLLVVLLLMTTITPSFTFAGEVEDWIFDRWGSKYYALSVESNMNKVVSAMKSVKGVKEIKVSNGQLVIVHDESVGIETIKADMKLAMSNTILNTESGDLDIFASELGSEKRENPKPSGGTSGEETKKTLEEQFASWIGNNYEIPTSGIATLWEYYNDKTLGAGGKQAVEINTDSEGNITKVILNLDESQRAGTGISDTTATQIDQDNKPDDEGADGGDIGGILFRPIASLICGIGDACNQLLQSLLIGDDSEVFISQGLAANLTGGLLGHDSAEEYIGKNPPVGGVETIPVVGEYIKSWIGKGYGVPNIKLTPAEIFAGNVAALDANFFETNTDYSNKLGGSEKSIVLTLKGTISKWYVSLRNIAIVGLLSVLLYIGIRIIISSNAGDKAKYKQFFIDWIVALCLIFFLHYIMSFTMTISETITDVLSGDTTTQGTIKQVNISITDEGKTFSSNFTGVARIKAQYSDSILMMGYSILYLALTVYTVYFAFIYLKRLLMLSFFTIISPLVALTYPLDKMKDGHAQAFNYWFKEYMFYAILQPLHMLLYTVFVSSALSIAAKNLLYAIVALAFIVPAEKILKQMFGIKGATESSLGGFAGGALASQAFSALRKNMSGGNKNTQNNASNNKIRQAKNPNAPDSLGTLAGDATGLDETALAAGAGAAMGLGAGAALTADNVNTQGSASVDTYQNTSDQVAATEKEDLKKKLADEQIDIKDLTPDQRALLGISEPHINEDKSKDKNADRSVDKNADKSGNKLEIDKGKPTSDLPKTKDDNKFKAYRKKIANNFKRAANQRYVAAGGWKGIGKSALKGAAKGYGKLAGTVAMGAIGLGAGIVGGDMSDTLKGMGAGLAAGSIVANKAENMIGNTFSGNSAVGRFASDVFYGDDEGRRKQFIKQYMNNPENTTRILEKNPGIKLKELEKQQEAEAAMMYDTGVSDYSTIKSAVKMEKELSAQGNQKPHDMAVALTKLGQNYDNSTFTNKSKFEQAQKALEERLAEQMKANLAKQIDEQLAKKKDLSASDRVAERQKRLKNESANIAKQANVEATQTLDRIRRMKKTYE